MTVAYGNLLVAGPYGFPPARERRENEKGLGGVEGAFSFSGLGYIGPVFPEKGGTYMTVAYGNLLVAGLYGFPPARERRENEKALPRRLRLLSLFDAALTGGVDDGAAVGALAYLSVPFKGFNFEGQPVPVHLD